MLPGGHVNVIEETDNLTKRLEGIVPDESICKTPPLEKWFPDVLVDVDPDLLALSSAGAVDVPADTTKAFYNAQEAIQAVQDLISIESKRLVYKADAAIGKATKL